MGAQWQPVLDILDAIEWAGAVGSLDISITATTVEIRSTYAPCLQGERPLHARRLLLTWRPDDIYAPGWFYETSHYRNTAEAGPLLERPVADFLRWLGVPVKPA